jgi:hypothetical protein
VRQTPHTGGDVNPMPCVQNAKSHLMGGLGACVGMTLRTFASDGEVLDLLSCSQLGGQPLGLQASAAPCGASFSITVLGGHLGGLLGLRGLRCAHRQVIDRQAVFGHQITNFLDGACVFGSLGLRDLGIQGGALGDEVGEGGCGHCVDKKLRRGHGILIDAGSANTIAKTHSVCIDHPFLTPLSSDSVP